ncbi:hypothetical protein D3H35_00395 [Cohnella faecalis]|uniref:Uncharacterized protein n=1 Tax=Cohnella faecalis TaxID=2315694 RepID=A0A398CY41_9BACL|nr:hypothetical protein D3H35_00395 [Cohnella faecalis]
MRRIEPIQREACGIRETRLYGETGKYRILQFADAAVQGAADLKNRVASSFPIRGLPSLDGAQRPSLEDVFVIGQESVNRGAIPQAICRRGNRREGGRAEQIVFQLSAGYNVIVGDGRTFCSIRLRTPSIASFWTLLTRTGLRGIWYPFLFLI